MTPDPKTSCGPYKPSDSKVDRDKSVGGAKYGNSYMYRRSRVSKTNHDTIGLVAVDMDGHVVSGATTNGMNHKVPG